MGFYSPKENIFPLTAQCLIEICTHPGNPRAFAAFSTESKELKEEAVGKQIRQQNTALLFKIVFFPLKQCLTVTQADFGLARYLLTSAF